MSVMNNISNFKKFKKISENVKGFWGTKASGILPFNEKDKTFLIGLRSDYVREPRTWSIFGGAIGLDDHGRKEKELSPKDNALKEFKEETGFSNDDIDLIDSYIFKADNFIYYNYIGILKKDFKVKLNWENIDYKWVTFEEMIEHDNLHFGLKELITNNFDQLKNLIK